MAYTGLGAGTLEDPFQINTVTEFKEIDRSGISIPVFTGVGLSDFTSNSLSASADAFIISITTTNSLKTSILNSGGSGYLVNDLFTVDTGTPGLLATGKVLTVNSGSILTYSILTYGSGYAIGNGIATTTTVGIGTGLKINITVLGFDTANIKLNGSNFTSLEINGNLQFITSDVSIQFISKTGHTVGDRWDFNTLLGAYYILMNNINWISEPTFSISSFNGHLDGNGFELQNLPSGGGGITITNSCSITDCVFRFTRTQIGSSDIVFSANNVNRQFVSLTKLHIIVTGTAHLLMISNPTTFHSSCTVNNIVAEGDINAMFGVIYCPISYLRLLRLTNYSGSMISEIRSSMSYCQIIAPFAAISSNSSISLLVRLIGVGGSVKECFASGNIVVNYAPSTNTSVTHGMFLSGIGTGQTIIDSYFKGNISVNKGEITSTASGDDGKSGYAITPHSGASVQRCYYSGNIDTPLNNNRTVLVKEYNIGNNYVQKCFYNKTNLVSITPKDVLGQQTGLTTTEFTNSDNFIGWNFSTIWQMGVESPTLRNNPFYNYELPARVMGLPLCVRNSSSQFTVNLQLGVFDNSVYGVDLLLEDTLIYNGENILSNVITVDNTIDGLYIIKPYWLNGDIKEFQAQVSYKHYCKDAALNTTALVTEVNVSLTGVVNAKYVHGSCLYNGYIYGSTRNTAVVTSQAGCIVKAPEDNISAFVNIPIYLTSEGVGQSAQMEQLVVCGEYLYVLSMLAGGGSQYLVQFNPVTDGYKVFKLSSQGTSQPIITDGEYLYISEFNGSFNFIHKVDPLVFIQAISKFNTSILFSYPKINTYDDRTQGGHILGGYLSVDKGIIHTTCVDSDYLYLGYTTKAGAITDRNGYAVSLNKTLHELQVVNKHTMLAAGWIYIPKATDDMCQTSTHLYFGYEIQQDADSRTYGYGWGVYAVRKSDLRLTSLPKLHSNDTLSVTSYASLIFGNYLLDSKTNKNTYILDISDVDNWMPTEPIGSRTLKTYSYETLSGIPNEFLLSETSGKFCAFLWGDPSGLMQVTLTGLSYFAVPTVNTISSVVISGTIALTGYTLLTGGHTITSKGFHYGTSSDNLSSTILSEETTSEFHGILSGLTAGTYYYQAFAINSEGESIAEIKSFVIANTIPFYVGSQHVTKIYLGSLEVTLN